MRSIGWALSSFPHVALKTRLRDHEGKITRKPVKNMKQLLTAFTCEASASRSLNSFSRSVFYGNPLPPSVRPDYQTAEANFDTTSFIFHTQRADLDPRVYP